jgi:hypothetical protein
MLALLLRPRLRYYRHSLCHQFDRVTRLEAALIILFYLAGRSPVDVGYSLEFMSEPDFSRRW